MSSKKSSAKKTAAPVPPPWNGPFFNQFSCLVSNTYEIPVSKIPIRPEYIVGCLQNLAAFEHQSADNTIAPGPAEWCQQYLSRVLREQPQAMRDALTMHCGTDMKKDDREAMRIARGIVAIAASLTGENAQMITVSDLRDLIKKYHASLYIPSGKRVLANWLVKAKLKHLGQRRGKAKSAGMKAFEAWADAGNYFPEQK